MKADIRGLIGSNTPAWNSGGTADILPAERAKCSFDVETMTNFLDGGKKETFRRRWITGSTEDMKDVGGTSLRFDLERVGNKGAVAENFRHFMEIHKEFLDKFYVPKGREMLYMIMGQTMGGYPGFGLFLTTILGQSSPEQLGWWLSKTYSMQITGSYAQTELGHGSNVRGLETTAEFDKRTGEFVLNTPTLTSIKWWPSSLATSTHCVLYAQLIIDGKQHGLHVFMLQLRDEKLRPLPGIEVGDIGTKAGEAEIDIGYLRLKDVRIPRRHMFEKKAHVEPDGKYVSHATQGSGDDKSHYLTMMTARVSMVAASSVFLAKGATIAIRYNCVRTQGFKDTKNVATYKAEEHQIMDYKMNQYVLLKNLALSFCIRVTSNWLSDRLSAIQASVQGGNADAGDEIVELHASAAGLKGFCCNAVALGLEEMRKCCGGAGYLQASGIAPLVADYKWRATAEGDTTVMLLQTARYLVKMASSQDDEKSSLAAVLAPLRDARAEKRKFDPFKFKPKSAVSWKDFMNLSYLSQLFQFRTLAQVNFLCESLDRRMASGQSYDEAWTELTLKAVRTGQSHILFFMFTKFTEMVEACENDACKSVLKNLCVLFALGEIMDGQQWSGLLEIDQIDLVEQGVDKLCAKIRPNAIGLVDAWDFHDKALNSTIGRYDGNVYEAQYVAAVNSPLNQEKFGLDGEPEVPQYFEVFKKYLDLDFLKLNNGLCDKDLDPNDCSSYPVRPKSKL